MFTKKTTRSALVLLVVLALAAPIISAVSSLPVAPVANAEVAAVELPETEVPMAAAPAAEQIQLQSQITYDAIRVDGVPMTADPMITDVNGETYVSLRAVAQALDSAVEAIWDGQQAKVVHWGVVDVIAVPGQCYVTANERCLYVPSGVQTANGAVLVPLSTVCKAFDASLTDNGDGTFALTRGSGAITPAWEFYNSDDLYWLSHIINAESGNQPLSGKMAVGNVVLNRVADSRFPDTVKGVVFQKNQFTPVRNGSINKTPNAESMLAAKLCLDGGEALEGVLWFNVKGLSSWASRNRTAVATIAGHTFFA